RNLVNEVESFENGRVISTFVTDSLPFPAVGTGGKPGIDKVKLRDVQVLTLYSESMTSGRRSSPVPHLRCVGGGASCGYTPKVVQCYNRGSNGEDWECKADLDSGYKFGRISVTCEGYDYPADPYILKGSCGLEYTLDLTNPPKTGFLTKLTLVLVAAILFYVFYTTCIKPVGNRQRSNTNDDNPRRPGPPGSAPPPPGFRSDYYGSGHNSGGGFFDGGGSCNANAQGSSGGSGGGFWAGAATGGLVGYMFGRNNNGSQQGVFHRPSSSQGWGSSTLPSSGSGSSTTSSGFGGMFGSDKKVRLADVKVLTLHSGAMTNGRRISPVPQLQCVGGCGQILRWECKAEMEEEYRFGQITISCEGYDYPKDEYILVGSCGLEYTLVSNKEINGTGIFAFVLVVLLIVAAIVICVLVTRSHAGADEVVLHPAPGSVVVGVPYRRHSDGGFLNGAAVGYMVGRDTNRGYHTAYHRSATHYGGGGGGVRTGFGGTARR
ncbi:Store-operated calcium entry-associated regulatory factor, partial [Orchesella cincta]